MMYHLYFSRYLNFVFKTYCNWTVYDSIFALIFLLILLKLISQCEIIFTNDEHVFLRIFFTHLRALCFDIYGMPTMCTPHRIIKVDSILYQKFAWWIYSPFWHEVWLLYFSRNNLLRVLTFVCRHWNIQCV